MRKLIALVALLALTGCRSASRDPRTVVFLIESSPASLDPRIGSDAQSEHIDELIRSPSSSICAQAFASTMAVH